MLCTCMLCSFSQLCWMPAGIRCEQCDCIKENMIFNIQQCEQYSFVCVDEHCVWIAGACLQGRDNISSVWKVNNTVVHCNATIVIAESGWIDHLQYNVLISCSVPFACAQGVPLVLHFTSLVWNIRCRLPLVRTMSYFTNHQLAASQIFSSIIYTSMRVFT